MFIGFFFSAQLILIISNYARGDSITETNPAITEVKCRKIFDVMLSLDGPTIRNANCGDSQKTPFLFHSIRAIRTNRLKPAIQKS